MRKLALQGLSTDNVSRPLPEFPQEKQVAPTLSTERSKGQLSPVSKYSDVPVEIKQSLRKENVKNLGRLVERSGGPNTPKGRAAAAVLEERGVNPFLAGSDPQMAKSMPYNTVKLSMWRAAVEKLAAIPVGALMPGQEQAAPAQQPAYTNNRVARGAGGGMAGGAMGAVGGTAAGAMAGGVPGAIVGGVLGTGVGTVVGGLGGQFKSASTHALTQGEDMMSRHRFMKQAKFVTPHSGLSHGFLGAGVGAGVGALTGDDSSNRLNRALTGAAIGAAGGYGIKRVRDAAYLRQFKEGDQLILGKHRLVGPEARMRDGETQARYIDRVLASKGARSEKPDFESIQRFAEKDNPFLLDVPTKQMNQRLPIQTVLDRSSLKKYLVGVKGDGTRFTLNGHDVTKLVGPLRQVSDVSTYIPGKAGKELINRLGAQASKDKAVGAGILAGAGGVGATALYAGREKRSSALEEYGHYPTGQRYTLR
jgi:hypothetical protein